MTGDRPAFVDTNVLIYAFEKLSSDRKTRAKELVARLLETGSIRFSTQVFQEFFVTLTRKGPQPCSPEEALSFLDDLAVFPFVAVDYDLIREAILLSKEAVLSFWDALIVIAAVRSGASILYTEDLNPSSYTQLCPGQGSRDLLSCSAEAEFWRGERGWAKAGRKRIRTVGRPGRC